MLCSSQLSGYAEAPLGIERLSYRSEQIGQCFILYYYNYIGVY